MSINIKTIVTMALFWAGSGQVFAASPEQAFLAEIGFTSTPIGHANFCGEHPAECLPNGQLVQLEILTDALWRDLVEVNAAVNAAVVPVTDQSLYNQEEFWAYPQGYGDCEDFVLAKRQALIARGWPASTLLMTVVREANGEGHAVLMVRTDRGDLVLDNQEALIKLWSETPYSYIKRQSQSDAGRWVDLNDTRIAVPQVASVGN
jgi:predicted transglutaminase-like cysteine proteinase